jgi:hypothetical protein
MSLLGDSSMTLNEREAFEAWYKENDGKYLHALERYQADIDYYPNNDYIQMRYWVFCAGLRAAKALAVPDTHVLVEKSKISTWWQDADEPENFASTEEQLFGMIAESEIYIDDMLVVEKHVQAQLSTQKLYCVYQITNKETGLAEIKVCESKSEAEEILNNNAKWVAEKEADQYESMNAFFEEEERKSGSEG